MNFHQNPIQSKKTESAGLNFLWLELTEKCNLFCVHCYNNSGPFKEIRGEMNCDAWKRVIKEAYNGGCRSLQFIGGEATMHPDLEELIVYSYEIGYDFIELFSNLTVINDKLISLLKRLKVKVAGSFYSPDAKTHDGITQRNGSFIKTLKGLNRLLDENIPVRIGIIEMDENRGHVPSAIEYLEKLGVSREHIGTDSIRSYGRGNCGNKPNISYDSLCGQCGKGKLCVTSSGVVHPCIMSRMVIAGNVLFDSVDEILKSNKLAEFREQMSEIERQKMGQDCNPQKCNPQRHCYPDNTQCSPQDCQPIKAQSEVLVEANSCRPQQCSPQQCWPDGSCNIHCTPDKCTPDNK